MMCVPFLLHVRTIYFNDFLICLFYLQPNWHFYIETAIRLKNCLLRLLDFPDMSGFVHIVCIETCCQRPDEIFSFMC